jgi:hypothetical protein
VRNGPLSFSQDMTAHITSLTCIQRPRIILSNYQTRQIHSLPTTHLNSRLTYRMTTSSSPAAKYHNHNLSSPPTDLKNTTSKKSSTHDDAVKGGSTLSAGRVMVLNTTAGSPGPLSMNAPCLTPGSQGQTQSRV